VRFGNVLRARVRYAGPVVAIAGVVLLASLMENLYAYGRHDLWSAVWQVDRRPLIGASFALVALGWLVSPRWWQRLLDNVPLRFLAAISYNLYLYHQIVARELLAHRIPPYAGDPHRDAGWRLRYTEAAFALSIAEAAFVTYCFERPLLRLQPPRLRR